MPKRWFVVTLCFLPWVAWGQLPDETLEVVGFGPKSGVAVVRHALSASREEGGFSRIHLQLVDLASGRVLEKIPVLTGDDQDREKTRARRWRAAQARLVAAGYTFAGPYPLLPATHTPSEPLRVRLASLAADVVFRWGPEDGSMLGAVDLFVEAGQAPVLVRRRVALVPRAGDGGLRAASLDPLGQYLLVMNVVDETRSNVVVVPVEEVARALATDACPTPAAGAQALLEGRPSLPKGWELKQVGAALQARGPVASFARLTWGDSAGQETTTHQRGPAQLVLRVTPRSAFTCPAVPGHEWVGQGVMPVFESACFDYWVEPPSNVIYQDTKVTHSLDPLLLAAPGVTRSTRSCPGFSH